MKSLLILNDAPYGTERSFNGLRLAKARDVPPYVVFSDKTLRAIASSQPTTAAAFLRCPGVGERKLEAYGGEFLRAVREFVDTGNCPED